MDWQRVEDAPAEQGPSVRRPLGGPNLPIESRTYNLISTDQRTYVVNRKTLGVIGQLREFFEVFGADYIPVDEIGPIRLHLSSEVLEALLEWCAHHKDDAPDAQLVHPLLGADDGFEHGFFVRNRRTLFELYRATVTYNIPALNMQCQRVMAMNDPPPEPPVRGVAAG